MHVHWMKYAWQIGFREHRAGRSSEPFAQKLIEIPFIMTVALQRNREREARTEKDEYNDFWLQRQQKPRIMCWHIITKNYAISQLKKVNTPDEHLVILFTNVTVCLNAIHIFFTRKPAYVYDPAISENSRQVLSKQTVFKYIFWKNSNNYFSLLQTKRHIDMIRIPWSTNVLIPQDSAGK